MMKKIITLTLITLLVLTGCGKNNSEASLLDQIKSKGKIVMVTSPDYAPYEWTDPSKSGMDKYVGADIELAKFIAEELGVELEIKPMGFDEIASAISLSKFDIGIAGFTYSEERAEKVLFSDTYDTSESVCQGFLVKKETEATLNSLEDLKNAKVAVQNGSLQQTYVEKELPEANKQLIKSLDDAVIQLDLGKVDAVAASCASAEGFLKINEDFVISKVKFESVDDNGTKVIMPKGETELLDAINAAIEKAASQDLYTQWLNDAKKLAESQGV